VLTPYARSGKVIIDDSQPNHSAEIKKIKQLFADWQENEIKAGYFWASDSCNPGWFTNHIIKENFDSIKGLVYGLPSDSEEYTFSFADLNNDNRLDGLVVFKPDQCDGGIIAQWIQWQVFLLSAKDHYTITDTIQVDKFASTDFDSLGFYWLDSIKTNEIFGTYNEFKKDYGNSWPHRRLVTFDFANRKLTFIGEDIDMK